MKTALKFLPENEFVDIGYDLVSKANDQVEFSAGWGQTGIIGKLSLKFTNFSLANLLHPGENYRGILPQGDGQTLTVSATRLMPSLLPIFIAFLIL